MDTYEQLRQSVANLLGPIGFAQTSQTEDVDFRGSKQTKFSRDEDKVLVGWEGEDKFAYVEVWQNQEWSPLAPRITAVDDASIRAQIERVCQAAMAYAQDPALSQG